ncbi:phage tail tube protein [Marinicauda sp. Alg238-R41]|uniref:phage tail tube protein n=1 Tax=Marinicauda sp. Alg238-R41 TaxID=2993447 RepID=UPI0022E3F1D3|nr:phage tail tube protein [Marinicauda sp. Alg238-R41]
MAIATSIKFGKQAVLLGDGATSEVFTAPCGITSLTKSTNVEVSETQIPDCDDPDALSQVVIDEIARSKTLSGSGTLSTEALDTWRDWDDAGGEKNVRWFTDLSAGDGGGHYQGAGILTSFEETGERGGRWQVSFEIRISGPFPFTAAS